MTRIAFPCLAGLVALGLSVPGLAAPALAKAGKQKPSANAPVSDIVAKEKAAKKACATGDYQRGVDILADLFVDTNEAIYVYNQGRCYQQNNRWEQAITRFREYLRKAKDISEGDRAETQRQIDECQDALAKATPAPPPPVTTPLPDASTTVPPAGAQPVKVPRDPPAQPPQGNPGRGLRIAGIIVGSMGVAALAGGVGLSLKARSLSSTEFSRSREDERSTLKTWGLVSYGVGAAAIATGAVLYVVGWRRQDTSSLALVPTIAPDGASFSLQGGF